MYIWLFVSLILLILLSAFFSGSEIAFASVNKTRLKKVAASGNPYAKTALSICMHFEDALSTILIGNNVVNIGAASVSAIIAISVIGESGVIVSSFIMTILIIIFGEITPKIIAKRHSYKFTLFVAYPLRFLMVVLKPIITITVWVVNIFLKVCRQKESKEPSVTEEELVSLIESVADVGIIDEDRSELLQSALEFSNISAQDILTPRTDMVVIDIDDDIDAIVEIALNSPYSRIPVYEGTVDNVIGILHLGQFLKELVDKKHIDLRSLLIEAYFIHQTMKLPAIFSELKRRRLQMAVVTDEYGGTMGCITMEDVLEELVGEIWDEADEISNDFMITGENTYVVSGDLSIHDFLEYLDIDERDFESDYKTVGGWAIEVLNKFPNINDSFEYKNLTVTVIALDGLRVAKLSIVVKPFNVEQEKLA